jgi:hypothetical protein
MITASELTPDLKIIKKSLGVPLIKFEDAKIELGESGFSLIFPSGVGLLVVYTLLQNETF